MVTLLKIPVPFKMHPCNHSIIYMMHVVITLSNAEGIYVPSWKLDLDIYYLLYIDIEIDEICVVTKSKLWQCIHSAVLYNLVLYIYSGVL